MWTPSVARARQNWHRRRAEKATAWHACHGSGLRMLQHRTAPAGPGVQPRALNRDHHHAKSDHRRGLLAPRPPKAHPPCRPASPGARSSPAASSPSRSGPCSTSSAWRSAPARWMRPPAAPPARPASASAPGIWLLVANLIGLAVGGYVAARLSGTADSTDSVLHGLSVWAIGFLLSAVLLGNVIAGTASTAAQGGASLLGGLAQGAGSAASAAAGPAGQAMQQVDPKALVDRAQSGAAHRRRPGADEQRPAQCRDRPAADPPRHRRQPGRRATVTGSASWWPPNTTSPRTRRSAGCSRSSSRPPRRRRRPSGAPARRPMPRRRPARSRPTGSSRRCCWARWPRCSGARIGTRSAVAVRRYA